MVPQSIPLCLLVVALWIYLLPAHFVAAQVLVNGQLFTNGLAIVDAPALNSIYQAGGTMAIEIDVSGNGQLSQSAQVPGCGLPTRFEGLQIFLISDSSEFNMTISDDNAVLYQERGSNVKDLIWTIPLYTPSGNYNVTLYEASVINDESFYTITPIPIIITSLYPGQCSDLNQFQAAQSSSPSPQSPWLTSECSTCSIDITIISYPTATQAVYTSLSSSLPVIPLTLPSSSGHPETVTVETASKTCVVAYETLTKIVSGVTSMMTISMTSEVEVPAGSINFVGYIPADGGEHLWMPAVGTLMVGGLVMLTIVTLLL